VFDYRTSTFKAEIGKIPGAVLSAASEYRSTAHEAHAAIKRKLDDIQHRLDERLAEYDVDPYGALEKIEVGFKKSAQALEVQPTLDSVRAAQMARDYNKSLKLPIKKFAQDSINTLREAVDDNAMEGYRFDRLKDMIKQRYGVTASKAKFLARQETSLFMSKYRQQRFDQAGVKTYRWSTAHDERVRSDHKHLNGRVFSYDNPPITDTATGARNNPGEDFNCRCLDIPLLDKAI
jgi:SPP1 gp7 family putative phage head morphogenesis protein